MSQAPAGQIPPLSSDRRHAALARLRILDTPRAAAFDELTSIAAAACRAPVALVSLVDIDRQWFLAERGLGLRETGLDNSVCATALDSGGLYVVPDLSSDARYAAMEIVAGPRHMRFYAGAPIHAPDGVPVGMLCVLDTEARPEGLTVDQAAVLESLARQASLQLALRQREQEIDQGRASLIRFFDRAPVGLLQTDLGGDVTYVNQHYAEILGRDAAQTLGRRLADFVHPDDAEAHNVAVAKAIGGEDPVVLEKRYITPAGSEIWASDQVTVSRDHAGRALTVVFAARDITERLRITSQLAESERKFRAITDAMPQMVWSTLPDGRADYYNERWYNFTGVDPGAHDGDAWNEALHPDDRDRAAEIWSRSVQTGEPYEIEYRLRHRSGKHRWVLARALPVQNGNGSIERWFGSCTDIEDIKQSEEARTLLAHELSHRIKNIFAVVSGLVSLTARGEDGAQPFAKSLRERLNALSLAHEYVRPGESGVGTHSEARSVFGLLRTLLRPYIDGGEEPYRFAGTDAEIGSKTATALALVMHEQATNAVKYGALSRENGSVLIQGDVVDDVYVLRWIETGGPPLDGPPTRSGFGTDMAARSAAGQLGGRIEHFWEPGGLTVTLTVPLSHLAR